MVEMTELSHILSRADAQSLILLDEIGRGTSTYDGISVAWSTIEWIKNEIQARTLFATHYHELTRLSGVLDGIQNVHLAVEENENGELRFLYKLQEGATSDSYGIQVAKMAGIPESVIDRAWEILKGLENNEIYVKNRTQKSLRRNTKVSITDQLHLI
jgi:DNA mismatch repair protein MutS